MYNFKFYLFLMISLSFLLTKSMKPNGDEKLYKLAGISNEETRSYYLLDESGLNYSNLSKYIKPGEKFSVKIVARSHIAPHSKKYKNYGYNLKVKKGKSVKLDRNLMFRKKTANVTSVKNQGGFKFTEPSFWYEELVMHKDLKIQIREIDGNPDVFIRVLIEKIDKIDNVDKNINPLDRQFSYTISYVDDNKLVKSKDWLLINNNTEQKFKIKGPKIIRVLTRSIYSESLFDNYSINYKQDGIWMSDQLFLKEKSKQDAKIISGDLKNQDVSSFKSFYINIPEGIHYYSFDLTKDSKQKNEKVLLRLDEYKISK
tara:strand:- start:89 stop:1030 length:942 start_codon:yes stop_codon:yes gene_type:complete